MPKAPKSDPHYPNPWFGRVLVIGLSVLVLGLLAFAVLRPSSDAEIERAGEASVVQMDAAQQRADNQRAADRSLQ